MKKTPARGGRLNPSRFKFEKVNDATWKLTNGEMTNVPTRIGFWGGYRTTKAIAWVINIAPDGNKDGSRVLAAITWRAIR